MLAYRVAREGLELARHLGMRGPGYYLLGNASDMARRIGEWESALPELEEAIAYSDDDFLARIRLAQLRGLRGEDVAAELEGLAASVADLTEFQTRAGVAAVRAEVQYAQGDVERALEQARLSYGFGIAPDGDSLQFAARAGAALGDTAAVREALALLERQPGRVAEAATREARAALAALEGRPEEAVAGFMDALRRYHELGVEVDAAVCAINMLTTLGATQPEVRAAAEAAAAFCERIGAKALQKRLSDALRSPGPKPEPRAPGVAAEPTPRSA